MATLILIIAAALAVWFESTGSPLGGWFGIKPELLPPLIVYAGLTAGARPIVAVALVGGLLQDSLSVGPLGLSAFPLCVVGLALNHWQVYFSRDETMQQLVLGSVATLFFIFTGLIVLGLSGSGVSVSFGLLVRVFGVALVGAAATPVIFWVLDRVNRLLGAIPKKYEAPSPSWSVWNPRREGPPRESARQRAYK